MKNFFRMFSIIALVAVIGFSMTACDNGGGSPSPIITPTAPAITTTSLPDGKAGTAYNQTTLQATGDTPITWSKESGDLPNGLTLSAAGVISGTPATAGTSNFTVKATNAAGSDTKTLSIVIAPSDTPSDITYTVAQSGGADNTADTTGIAFTFSASVDNLTAADITVGGYAAKPANATLTGSGTTWTLAVTVSDAGQATVSIAKTGIEAGTKHVTVYKAGQTAPTLTGITAVYTGTAVIYPTTPLNDLKTNLTVKAQYSNSTEVTLSGNEYALSGTLAVGASAVTVTYQTKTTTFNVTVTTAPAAPAITTSSLPGGTVGTAYSQTLTATGDTPITWSIQSGTLPAGLTLSNGTISGTPATAGTSNFTVKAANAAGDNTKALSIVIASAPITVSIAAIPGVTIPVRGKTPVSEITETTQYSGTVEWNNNPSTFAPKTVYTATITLTVKSGYTLQGVTADFFTVAGATKVNNSANTGVITAEFPVTGWEKIFQYTNSTMGSYFDLLDYCPDMVSSDILFDDDPEVFLATSKVKIYASSGTDPDTFVEPGIEIPFDDNVHPITPPTSGTFAPMLKRWYVVSAEHNTTRISFGAMPSTGYCQIKVVKE